MTKRALWYAVTQPKVLLFSAIGAGLLFIGAPVIAACVMFGIATIKATRVLSHRDLDDRLRLQADKHRHGIHRMLAASERDEILAIDHYAKLLREMGASPELAEQTLNQAWLIIRQNGSGDATAQLKVFRHNLPALRQTDTQPNAEPQEVARQIEHELQLLRAAKREIELVG